MASHNDFRQQKHIILSAVAIVKISHLHELAGGAKRSQQLDDHSQVTLANCVSTQLDNVTRLSGYFS